MKRQDIKKLMIAVASAMAKGPKTPGTGGGSVEAVPGEPGVYVVQPDISSGNVTIESGLRPTNAIRVTK